MVMIHSLFIAWHVYVLLQDILVAAELIIAKWIYRTKIAFGKKAYYLPLG